LALGLAGSTISSPFCESNNCRACCGAFGAYRRRATLCIARLEKESTLAGERERIARDLHDDLGGSLADIALTLEIIRSRLGEGIDLDHELEKMSSFARSAIENMGQTIWSNNPRFDNLASLSAYLREYASNHTCFLGPPPQFAATP
jgi:signal transduction histidine kinase